MVEKEKDAARKFEFVKDVVETVGDNSNDMFVHVPLAASSLEIFELDASSLGWKTQNDELVVHDPAYTPIDPDEDIDGRKTVLLLALSLDSNGRSVESIFGDRVDAFIVVEMLRAASWTCGGVDRVGKNKYTKSTSIGDRNILVGLYGSDSVVAERTKAPKPKTTSNEAIRRIVGEAAASNCR
jgi:hypothetical protein